MCFPRQIIMPSFLFITEEKTSKMTVCGAYTLYALRREKITDKFTRLNIKFWRGGGGFGSNLHLSVSIVDTEIHETRCISYNADKDCCEVEFEFDMNKYVNEDTCELEILEIYIERGEEVF